MMGKPSYYYKMQNTKHGDYCYALLTFYNKETNDTYSVFFKEETHTMNDLNNFRIKLNHYSGIERKFKNVEDKEPYRGELVKQTILRNGVIILDWSHSAYKPKPNPGIHFK
jgi:hypothetical protein